MKSGVRLPSHIKPEKYQILIKPDLDNFTFSGEETIDLLIDKSTRDVVLHSHELDIESAEVIHNGTESWAGKISYDKKAETAKLEFPRLLPKGRLQLNLKFRGILSDKMFGFYRSKYLHEGREKHLVTTQFEATYARRAFPCFDEPSLKATFEVSLVIPESMIAISNTIETEIAEHESGYKIVKFAPSPKMSTYLLAYIVGDFEFIDSRLRGNDSGVRIRIFTTPGKKDQGKFALEVAVKCLEFYEDYFGIPYPLPVMDLIAIPDFAHGAMENWGAVTYKESALLVDSENTSAGNKQWVALVIAHELAHQWFGNLVTMEWWSHLWLNEGFASFIEYLAIDHIFPEWDIWTQFVYLEQGTALKLDSLKNTHPIEVDVHDPAEISEAFDKVSYSKGASVIRMLWKYLGDRDFRSGLRKYLGRHQYGNAATEDLWKAMEEASGKAVGKIMRSWTGKGGYPIIQVATSEVAGQIKLTQERFFSSPISKKSSKDTTLWNIPLNIFVNEKVEKYLMDKKELDSRLRGNDKLVKLNAQDAAFIRVNYSPDQLNQLKKAVEQKKLLVVDRLGLVRDAFDLAEAGYISTDKALDFVQSYIWEDDYTVWIEIASHMGQISSLVANESFYKAYKDFAGRIFKKIASKMGWNKRSGEKHTDVMLRSTVLHALGKYGDQKTIDRAQKLFGSKIDPDLKGVVYDLVAENGGEKEYAQLMGMYKKEQVQQERDRLGRALGGFKDQTLLGKTLEFSLSDEVRLQDKVGMMVRVWTNPKGRNLAWEFVKKNWKKFQGMYSGGHHLSRLVGTAGEFTSSRNAKDVEDFFRRNPVPEAKRTILQALEQIYSNEDWLGRDREKIKDFLVK